ncbi:MAG: alpha/beta hydrolase [Pseudomonadota bacterium]
MIGLFPLASKATETSGSSGRKPVFLASLSFPVALFAVFWVGLVSMEQVYRFVGWAISEGGTDVQTDIRYGAHARQRLDVYRPYSAAARKAGADAPLILFLYGGSWRDGDREIYRFVGDAFASRGYTTVIPDYRLYPDVQFPAFVDDVAMAYRWAEKNLLRPGQQIVMIGHSAGAHMTALVALDPRYLKSAGTDDTALAGWVGLAGPYAFEPTKWPSTKEIFASASGPDVPRPVTHVSPGEKPALLFHGLDDDVVKVWNMRELVKAFRAQGSDVRAVELPGVAHVGIVLALAKPFRSKGPVLDQTLSFIRSVSGKSPTRSVDGR